jgi:hypothetical protein
MKKPHTRTNHFNIFAIALAVVAFGALAWTAFDAYAGNTGQWRGHSGMAQACDRDFTALVADGKAHLAITAEQQATWAAFTASLDRTSDRLKTLCGDMTALPATAPEALALAETATVAGLEAIRDVRPAFDALYAVLDDEQRAIINEHMARHRGH